MASGTLIRCQLGEPIMAIRIVRYCRFFMSKLHVEKLLSDDKPEFCGLLIWTNLILNQVHRVNFLRLSWIIELFNLAPNQCSTVFLQHDPKASQKQSDKTICWENWDSLCFFMIWFNCWLLIFSSTTKKEKR